MSLNNHSQWENVVQPDLKDVPYGDHPFQKLDIYKPTNSSGSSPTPVVIYFHGGGFYGGSKERFNQAFLKECLDAGFTFISADYRLIQHGPFPTSMMDGVRATQFVRYMSPEWNLDEKRIALAGNSAGANLSLWMAFKGDFADPSDPDPVKRVSSRVSCIVAFNVQTSNDPEFIYTHIYQGNQIYPSTLGFFGVSSEEELKSPRARKLAHESSSINFVTSDAPPVFLEYNYDLTPTPLPADADMDVVIHHPRFGQLLKERMDKLGVECLLRYKGQPSLPGERIRFMQKHFESAR